MSADAKLFVMGFNRLTKRWEELRGVRDEKDRFQKHMRLLTESGNMIIEAVEKGFLNRLNIRDRVAWVKGDGESESLGGMAFSRPDGTVEIRPMQAELARDPANLFIEVCGNHLISVANQGTDFQSEGGALPQVSQAIFPSGDVREADEIEDSVKACEALAILIETEDPRTASQPDQTNRPAPGKGMTWQESMKAAEDHCARNPFPGVNALAKIVGCSPSTMSKAIDRSAKLRAKHDAQRKSVSAGAMTEGAAASAKQSREPDPIDAASASTDDLFRRLLEQAKPSERAILNAMTPAQRRELIATIEHDPDKRQSVRGPKR